MQKYRRGWQTVELASHDSRKQLRRIRRHAMQMIRRIHSERPAGGHSNFDRQALLARSGQYEMRDYMVVELSSCWSVEIVRYLLMAGAPGQ
jgi:hypothetical protein